VCSPAICPRCRKVTYSGCGGHVAQVLAKVPPEKRCTCRADKAGNRTPRRRVAANTQWGIHRYLNKDVTAWLPSR
jgi:hypothetical protein